MRLLRRLFRTPDRPMVLLQVGAFDTEWKLKPAEQFCDEWFASPYRKEETRTRLLPGGKVEGQCYVKSWKPATDHLRPLYTGNGGGD